MQTELEECNPKFIVWAKKNGISLEHHDDWYPWLECWADGYTSGVDDVKGIMSGTKIKRTEAKDPCPRCDTLLVHRSGGGVECPKENCDYWSCY